MGNLYQNFEMLNFSSNRQRNEILGVSEPVSRNKYLSHHITVQRENEKFTPSTAVLQMKNLLSPEKISSNQINFFRKTVTYTKFLPEKCEKSQFPYSQ